MYRSLLCEGLLTNISLQSKQVFCIEELLHDQSEPNVCLHITRSTLQYSGIAAGSTLEKVQWSLARRIVGIFPCKGVGGLP